MVSGSDATVLLAWLTVYAVGADRGDHRMDDGRLGVRARQARRLFPLCTVRRSPAASSGPCRRAGGRAFGTETLVVLEAIMLAIVGGLVVAVSRTTTGPRAAASARPVDRRGLRLGFEPSSGRL